MEGEALSTFTGFGSSPILNVLGSSGSTVLANVYSIMPPNSETPHQMHTLVGNGVCGLITLTLYGSNCFCSKIKPNVITFVKNHCGELTVTDGLGALSLAAAASFSSSRRRESSTALSSGGGLNPAWSECRL